MSRFIPLSSVTIHQTVPNCDIGVLLFPKPLTYKLFTSFNVDAMKSFLYPDMDCVQQLSILIGALLTVQYYSLLVHNCPIDFMLECVLLWN
jgi:hypothetical protein